MAQDSVTGGVAAAYTLYSGWTGAYPETTGYIIPTLFDIQDHLKEEEYGVRALSLAKWLISIQREDGAFQGGQVSQNRPPVVFNTGQIMIGLLKAYERTSDSQFLDSAKLAGDWLANVQEDSSEWIKFSYNNIPHTYHSRVAWPLLTLFKETKDKRYERSAEKHIDWVIANQLDTGWYENCTFRSDKPPNTHAISYTIRGLLESFELSDKNKYLDSVLKPSQKLADIFLKTSFLPATFDRDWKRWGYCGILSPLGRIPAFFISKLGNEILSGYTADG